MLVKLQSAVSLFTCGCLVSVAASPSSIGFVVTSGQVQVDGAAVHGNSTLFQGNVVRAGDATSDLMFPGGPIYFCSRARPSRSSVSMAFWNMGQLYSEVTRHCSRTG